MKPNVNPNFPTTGILIFAIGVGLFLLLAVGVPGLFIIREGLITGRVYSVGVIFNFTEKVSRNSSPAAYWEMMGLYSIGCVAGIGLGIFVPIATIRAYVKKLARQKKERDSQLNIGNH
jgi:hypothetical protein